LPNAVCTPDEAIRLAGEAPPSLKESYLALAADWLRLEAEIADPDSRIRPAAP